MRAFSFRKSLRIKIGRDTYRLIDKFDDNGTETWRIERLSDHLLMNRSTEDLLSLYAEEELHLDIDHEDETPLEQSSRRRRERAVIGDLPEEDRAYVAAMKHVLLEVDRRVATGMKTKKPREGSDSYLKIALREISEELGLERPVSQSNYYRNLKKFRKHGSAHDLIPKTSLRGNRQQIPPQVKTWMLDALGELIIAGRGRSITTAMAKVKAQIEEEKALDPNIQWKLPSRRTFYSYWKEHPAYDRAVQKYGPTRARHMFRSTRGHEGPEACLDLVEFDETRLPFYVIDDVNGVPLGSPHFAWCLDVYSQVPVGFYLGFEPPGDVVITSTLRHAMLPKSYVRTLYPDIRNSMPMMGRPRMLSIDNGLSQHGRTIESIALSADFDFKFTPVRTPWFKPVVERSFRLLNQLLLADLPGYQPPPGTILEAYDPKGHGLVSFNALLFIVHKWLADEYLIKPHSERKTRPIDLWDEGTRLHPPELLGSKTDLEALFGIVREGTLDHRGVVFEGLRYHSDELEQLLRQHGQLRLHGARMDVLVKINYDNLGSVRVFDPSNRVWIRAIALRRDYAEGLSLHRHHLYRKHARNRGRSYDPDEWLLAHHEIQEFVQKALPVNLGIRVNSAIGRALGFGSHTLTANVDISGQFVDTAQSVPSRLELSHPGSTPHENRKVVQLKPKPAKPVRKIPKFETDDSL